jgi:phenylalanyl-tRNA synthetase alpha chain
MEGLTTKILRELEAKEQLDSRDLCEDPLEVIRSLKRLESKRMVEYATIENVYYTLTEEGVDVLRNGSYEVRLFNFVGADGKKISEIDGYDLGKIHAFRNKWVRYSGEAVIRCIEEVRDEIQELVAEIDKSSKNRTTTLGRDKIGMLLKRRLIEKNKDVFYEIRKGVDYSPEIEPLMTELTSDMINTKAFSSLRFKDYNFNTKGKMPQSGSLHPLMKVREEVKNIFIEMGFEEMSTNKYVESSFWNFDALFQPQQHPSREAHDTFFIKKPSLSMDFPEDYLEKVSEVHSKGGYGSTGYMYEWKRSEAMKNVLRTHTTAVSVKYLYELSQKEFRPIKLFSIDKVFRNESVDATHLAEFHQIEGVVCGRNLTLGHLMGLIQGFFKKMGMNEVRFKPAYNPYTEPSMEVFAYHDGLKRWIEVGNSGVFRPEMLKPMGFEDEIKILGWGLSLERPAMIKYNITNIRDLLGHKVDLNFIRGSEICYF